jgi:DNA modification methylase
MEYAVEFIKVKDIKPYKKNAKKHPQEQIEYIKNSIKEFGFRQNLVVDKDNVIIIGHGRLEAAKQLGLEYVPCIKAEDLTEEQIKALRLADNKVAESEWDFDLLDSELDDIFDIDMSDFGFDLGEDDEGETEIEEDEAPEPPTEPKAKLGDLWQLGNHRLICGDSTDVAVIDRLMDGVKADMVFTDPPYNLQTEGGCKGKIGKDLKKQGKDIEFIADFNPSDFLNVLPIVFNGNMNAYIFCNKELLPDYLNWCRDNGYSWNVLIWKKPTAIPIGDSHRPDIEYLLLFRKNALWNNGTDANYSRCLQYDRVKKSEENGNHPTPKPIELIANELKISSNKNSIVVDFFGGSGSTLIACEQLERKCYMCELDEHYVDVIIQRYINLKGTDADVFLLKDGEKIPYNEL